MSICAVFADTNEHTDEDGPSWEDGTVYEVLQCIACSEISLRSYWWNDGIESEEEVKFKILYPSDPRIPLGLPVHIENAFRAALKVKGVDANAFGVLVGRVLELICIDRGAKGRFLSHKLRDLASKGEIPVNLVDVSGKLAGLRNIGAHSALGELTAREVPIVDDLCRAILDYIYTAPYLADKASKSLAAFRKP